MRQAENLKPIDASIYDEELLAGMGGVGSHEAFISTEGQNARPRLLYALELAALSPGLTVLDLACGRGEIVYLSAKVSGTNAIGIDYAAGALSSSRRTLNMLSDSIGGKAFLAQSDAKFIPLASESVNRVFMLDIVEHLHRWENLTMYREVRRILKPGGYAVIHTVPNRWAIDVGYPLARRVLRGMSENLTLQRDTFHVYEQTVLSLTRDLKECGLKCRVWLDDILIRHARWWHRSNVSGNEGQQALYNLIEKDHFRFLYHLAMSTPARLLVSNDLYAVAWRAEDPSPAILQGTPSALTERLLGAVFAR